MDFSKKLIAAIRSKNSCLSVGLDPHLDLFPQRLLSGIDRRDRSAIAQAVEGFCISIIDAVHDVVVAVKPQVAFFERLGPAGYQALESVVAAAKRRDLLVISDCKRGDIGSTAAAYADYHFGSVDPAENEIAGLGADAVTLSAYLGKDSLQPFAKYIPQGRGLFLLTKTSNKGSGDLQDRVLGDGQGEKVYVAIGHMAQSIADDYEFGTSGYTSVGLVVGATFPAQGAQLRSLFPRQFFLVPGVGAQGATPAEIQGCFDDEGLGAIVNAARSVIFAYREVDMMASQDGWQEASRAAALTLQRQINEAIASRTESKLPGKKNS